MFLALRHVVLFCFVLFRFVLCCVVLCCVRVVSVVSSLHYVKLCCQSWHCIALHKFHSGVVMLLVVSHIVSCRTVWCCID